MLQNNFKKSYDKNKNVYEVSKVFFLEIFKSIDREKFDFAVLK